MNETVVRIVEIMFQDVIVNEEVQALKDEIMNNCQERYQDLVARGLTEDEAIAAVVESLRGMEEVIAQYPRKYNGEIPEAAETAGEKELIFDGGQVKRIKVLLTKDDVNFRQSRDDLIHVFYDAKKMPNLITERHDNTLEIRRERMETACENSDGQEKEQYDWSSLSGVVNGIKRFFGKIYTSVDAAPGDLITVELPVGIAYQTEIHTTSGDVDMDEINMSELTCETTSGNLTMVLVKDVQPSRIKAVTVSGDVDVSAATAKLLVHTVSGDVQYKGDCPDIAVNTVSGDADMSGAMRIVNAKTVSGDMELQVLGGELQAVNVNTTSGDLQISLPAELRGRVAVHMQTLSGTKSNRYNEPTENPMAVVNVQSVSGDVSMI